jgi:hypothetical protein
MVGKLKHQLIRYLGGSLKVIQVGRLTGSWQFNFLKSGKLLAMVIEENNLMGE